MLGKVFVVTALGVSVAAAQSVRLPSTQRLFVAQGGDTPNVNSHMTVPAQAFGIDFAVAGGHTMRELSRGSATRVDDFFCWDTPVLAPAAGVVVSAVDTFPDNAVGVHDLVHPLGNHVVVQSNTRYFYLAHLRRGSVGVRVGDTIVAGATIGRCGNSGNSDFPHIHLHATQSPRVGEGHGLNLTFGPMTVELAGKSFAAVEWPLLRGLWLTMP